MKIRIFIFLCCTLLIFQASAATKKIDHLSYAMGYQLGFSFKQDVFPLDQDSFLQGLQSGYTGTKPILSIAEMKTAINEFHEHLIKKDQEKLQMNLAAGESFLEKNKKASGVKTLPNGLQYKIIQTGAGKKPTANDTVTVDYEGKLIDGTVFDSSFKRGEPAEFKVNQVIPGWTQALQMMPEGSTWILYIPANLAYGAREAGPIPPNSVLIFKVHLIKVS